eukprot:232135_1
MSNWQSFQSRALPQYGFDDSVKDVSILIRNSFEQEFKIPITVIVTESGLLEHLQYAFDAKVENNNLWIRRNNNVMGKDILIVANSPGKVNALYDVDIYNSLFHGLVLNQTNSEVVREKLSTVFNHTFAVISYPAEIDTNIYIEAKEQNNYYHHVLGPNGNVWHAYQTAEIADTFSSPWLLISGTTESPSFLQAVPKTRDGNYLSGIKNDLANMETVISEKKDLYELYNIYRDMRHGTQKEVLTQIERLIEHTLDLKNNIREYVSENHKEKNDIKKSKLCHIYYTGHGASNTGNWCFNDGDVKLVDIVNIALSKMNQTHHRLDVYLILDCCFSGKWNEQLEMIHSGIQKRNNKLRFFISAACGANETAFDTKYGGKFTRLILGQIGLNDLNQTPQPICWNGENENNQSTVWRRTLAKKFLFV